MNTFFGKTFFAEFMQTPKFFFLKLGKETEELTTQIVSDLNEEVKNFIPFNTITNGIEITVTFDMKFHMVAQNENSNPIYR